MTDQPVKIYIDFETYFNSEEGYTLKKTKKGHMSMVEYVRDKRYKTHGIGYAVEDGPIKWVSGSDVKECFKSLGWFNYVIIAHNAKFDGLIASEIYGIDPNQWICTQAMSRAVHGRRLPSHSLATIAQHYGFVPKGEMKTDGIKDLTLEQEKELADYCRHDVELCREIYKKLEEKFPVTEYKSMDWSIRTFVKPRLFLNVPLLEKTAMQEAQNKKDLFEKLQMDPALFRSNPKFAKVLVGAGFNVPTKKSPTTREEIPALALGDEAFQNMLHDSNEKLRQLCEARVVAKSTILETRSTKLAAIGKTGKWPFDIQYSGAMNTHRPSGGSGAGGNPLNFVRDSALRESVMPPEGYKFIVGDWAGIELRMVAFLARDPLLMESIRNGENEYCKFASELYKRLITNEDEEEYSVGKQGILGFGYGMGWENYQHTVKIKAYIDISEQEAKKAVYLYRGRYKAVKQLWYFLQQFIPYLTMNTHGPVGSLPLWFEKEKLILPSGLCIQYPNLRKEGREWIYDIYDKGTLVQRKLYGAKMLENISQALVGELGKDVINQFASDCTGFVYDELHLVVKKNEAISAKKNLEAAMSKAPSWMPDLVLSADVAIGENWKDANPKHKKRSAVAK